MRWDSVFVLPCWLRAWWGEFGSGAGEYLWAVRQEENIIGVAPLLIGGGRASFMGSPDICDYLDFVVAPGKETVFFSALLDKLRAESISELCLESLRPDSVTLTALVRLAEERGHKVSYQQADVSLDLDLPATWEEYLEMLTAKQRHEVRRKLRRLEEAGNVEYRVVADTQAITEAVDLFLELFGGSRADKAAFLTDQRESFFKSIARTMAEAGLLRFGILRLNGSPVAAVMYFDYQDEVYLYNSGYDLQYSSLSVGGLSQALCIKDSIHRGRKRFDFLKGAEAYKYRLGGKEIPIYSCRIALR